MADDCRMSDLAGLEVLSDDECRRLLATGGVGRVAVPGEPPIVRPVNFAFDENRIVIRTGAGPLWSAACRSVLVTFEVDDVRNVDHLDGVSSPAVRWHRWPRTTGFSPCRFERGRRSPGTASSPSPSRS